MNYEAIVIEAAARAANEAVDVVAANPSMLGSIDDLIASSMSRFFESYGPQMAAQFAKIAGPAAEKASEIIGPVIEEKLKAYTPTFALITGGVVAAAILFGGWFARREVRKSRGTGRRRRRRAA